MADRDPNEIREEIDRARDQLAATVDSLTTRAHPSRLAEDVKAAALRFVQKPAVTFTLVGLGTLTVIVLVRRVRNR